MATKTTTHVSDFKINYLTEELYQEALENGDIDENALYLTPDEEIDLSPYATVEQLNTKAPKSYILHGTIVDGTIVTLTNFNWDELVAAVKSTENIYVAMRLVDAGEAVYEFALSECDEIDESVKFLNTNADGFNNWVTIKYVEVLNDGSIICNEIANLETWTFTLEDGSTVEKKVYVG